MPDGRRRDDAVAKVVDAAKNAFQLTIYIAIA